MGIQRFQCCGGFTASFCVQLVNELLQIGDSDCFDGCADQLVYEDATLADLLPRRIVSKSDFSGITRAIFHFCQPALGSKRLSESFKCG